ncbi:hypothetical protein AB0J83_25005 [Actinoplanes sp. NPDC049596]|uniref:hypothetical protein n=1 Tax=unclassified Actinoplanes TaxID=2626549 RepID=UPI0034151C29
MRNASFAVQPVVAPYIDIVSGTADISAIASATGQKPFAPAFVVAGSSGSCTATWGGSTALNDSTVAAGIAEITALGGTPIVSTGGADGTYLETACSSTDALAAQYEAALDQAGSHVRQRHVLRHRPDRVRLHVALHQVHRLIAPVDNSVDSQLVDDAEAVADVDTVALVERPESDAWTTLAPTTAM